MDSQGITGCFMFPTLGVGMEEALIHDPEAAHAAFESFNRWLEDDWGYAYEERIFAAPLFTLLDPDRAVAELDRVLLNGARVIVMRAGPVMAPTGGRSPGDPVYDPFWARIAEAGITVAYHSGESGYGRYAADWGEDPEFEAFRRSPFKAMVQSDRAIADTMTALIATACSTASRTCGSRPSRAAASGSRRCSRRWRRSTPRRPARSPAARTRSRCSASHIWVAPYYEDDIPGLAATIGADRVLFGSDWPHAEGLADPASFVDDLPGFADDDIRRIMRDNALELSIPRSPAHA